RGRRPHVLGGAVGDRGDGPVRHVGEPVPDDVRVGGVAGRGRRGVVVGPGRRRAAADVGEGGGRGGGGHTVARRSGDVRAVGARVRGRGHHAGDEHRVVVGADGQRPGEAVVGGVRLRRQGVAVVAERS